MQQTLKVSSLSMATNCNFIANSIQFLQSNHLIFCSKNQVYIYSLEHNVIYFCINNRQIHANRANCLRIYYPNLSQTQEQSIHKSWVFLIVGYDSGHIVIYAVKKQIINQAGAKPAQLQRQGTLYDNIKVMHTIKQNSSIMSIHLTSSPLNNSQKSYFISNNNQGQIKEYSFQIEQDKVNIKETGMVQFPYNRIINSITTFSHRNSQLNLQEDVVFFGGVDQKIHVYTVNKNRQYQFIFSLSGHENGITKLTAVCENNNQKQISYLLASASKDGYIRLWKITTDENLTKFHKNVKTLTLFKNTNKQMKFKVFLEAVLVSHQCNVTSLSWSYFKGRNLQLISCSLDCTINIWGKHQDGSWGVENRMGQLIGNKNAYFQVIADYSYNQITKTFESKYLVAVNFIGSALIWQHNSESDKFSLRPSFNGHYNQVKKIVWNNSKDFLVSVSKDQTTRILAQHHKTKKFHEISRAQIHGYDINTVETVKIKQNTIDIIICGADEKVIRVIQPPACFANYLNSFTMRNLHLFFNDENEQNKFIKQKAEEGKPLLYEIYGQGGTQVLGLMTKMQRVQREKITNYYDEEQEQIQQQQMKQNQLNVDKTLDFEVPPHDDYLVKHTLWPQANKLYGHPHQIQALAVSNNGTFLASSCSALTKQSATILIWDTKSWKIIKIIQHHAYTVYAMKFTADDKYLVSVSKDRKMAVFETGQFKLIENKQCHTRAITCIDISSSKEEDNLIVTGSRDKTIKVHKIGNPQPLSEFSFKNAVFTVAISPSNGLIACGCQKGSISLLKLNLVKEQKEAKYTLQFLGNIPNWIGHTQTVNSIKWKNQSQFASCSDDFSVKIYKLSE